jgi:site-specific DNA recombinase
VAETKRTGPPPEGRPGNTTAASVTARRRKPAKRDTTNLVDLRVGLYCRVSLDKDDTGKSTTDQAAIGRAWADQVGAVVVAEYIEPGSRSASRFATKAREEFNRLVEDIEAAKLDAVWFWEQSRSSRRLDTFAQLRDICRHMGVLWVERDRIVDPNDNSDMLSAGFKALLSEQESEMTSLRVARGKESSARAGRRAGRISYGYRPVFDRDGRYLHDEADYHGQDGQPVEDSPAAIVREIYARVIAGDSITSIRKDLNARGIHTRQGYQWHNKTVRFIAMSPTYIAKRVYQVGEGIDEDRVKAVLPDVEVKWPALIDEESYWAAYRILSDPARKISKPHRSQHLLSALARCDVCGGPLAFKRPSQARQKGGPTYFCAHKACTGIYSQPLDAYVEGVVLDWLADPRVVAHLTRVDDSTAAAQARADIEQLRVELAALYRDVQAGRISPTIADAAERGLLARIDEAEQRLQAATLPAVLRGHIGPQARAGWQALSLAQRRQIIAAVADIRLRSVGRGKGPGGRPHPVEDRITWRWLLGPDA